MQTCNKELSKTAAKAFYNFNFFNRLNADEYSKIVRNLPEIVDLHSTLVKILEDCYDKPSLEQRVGNIFLSMVNNHAYIAEIIISI